MAGGLGLLLVSVTGAVGQAELDQALGRRDIRRITAPTRRPLSRHAAKPAMEMDMQSDVILEFLAASRRYFGG